jgi:mycofactocin precursor
MSDHDTAVVEADEVQPEEFGELVEDDVLIEEVSIDGMCGVY